MPRKFTLWTLVAFVTVIALMAACDPFSDRPLVFIFGFALYGAALGAVVASRRKCSFGVVLSCGIAGWFAGSQITFIAIWLNRCVEASAIEWHLLPDLDSLRGTLGFFLAHGQLALLGGSVVGASVWCAASLLKLLPGTLSRRETS